VGLFEPLGDVGTQSAAAHLAAAFARVGKSVVMVNLDLRRARENGPVGPGVADVLEGRVVLDELIDEGEAGRVDRLHAGIPSREPADLVADPGMCVGLVQQLQERADAELVPGQPRVYARSRAARVTDGG
jgi:hypothetical protein